MKSSPARAIAQDRACPAKHCTRALPARTVDEQHLPIAVDGTAPLVRQRCAG
jgi:hypothetical protein